MGHEHLPGAVDLDPLQGRRSSKVLVARNRLRKSTFRARMRVAADTIVQSLSGGADALLDCYNEKACKCRPFSKRLKGFEPSTFCMASGTWGRGTHTQSLHRGIFRGNVAWPSSRSSRRLAAIWGPNGDRVGHTGGSAAQWRV